MNNGHQLRQPQKAYIRDCIIRGSRFYNHYLLNKQFAIVTENFEICKVVFLEQDFLHFTGLHINNLNASSFFRACVSGTISEFNIKTNQYYNYRTLKYKNEKLVRLDKFIHVDSSTNLLLFNLQTNTCTFPYAIRNDLEDMTICFTGSDNHARSLRKARNSKNTQDDKQIIGIFEINNDKWDKCIYIRNKQNIVDNVDIEFFSDELKQYLHID